MNLRFLKKDFPKKRAALACAAVVLVAGVVAGRERPTIELLQERAPRAAAVAADDGIDIDKLHRTEASLPQNDPFAMKNFGNQGMASAQPGTSKPSAPPLPFQYIGKWTQGGKTDVLVMRGEELLAIEAGQKLGEYRVDKIGEASIAFTYLPMKTKQTLELPQ
jgi:hypothetical protein